ncbi:MAG: GAF domain-containing protein, partial [Candidatus Krumholzibacteria bacterium]|nr:GAF domain-containing protein [Candidatus Krumholzibacteria bacterium]
MNISGPKSEYIRKVSSLLLDFSGCDAVELCLPNEGKYCKCTATRFPEQSYKFEIDSYIKEESERTDGAPVDLTPLQRLSLDVLHGEPDTSAPFFTKKGSFWTGNCDNHFLYGLRLNGNTYERDLDISGPDLSLVLIPIKASDEEIGFLWLKSEKRDCFGEEIVHLFEDVAQTLGIVQTFRITHAALRERVKELTCLYDIARVAEQPGISLEQLFQRIVEFLPPAWQYPEFASSRIIFDEKI